MYKKTESTVYETVKDVSLSLKISLCHAEKQFARRREKRLQHPIPALNRIDAVCPSKATATDYITQQHNASHCEYFKIPKAFTHHDHTLITKVLMSRGASVLSLA